MHTKEYSFLPFLILGTAFFIVYYVRLRIPMTYEAGLCLKFKKLLDFDQSARADVIGEIQFSKIQTQSDRILHRYQNN